MQNKKVFVALIILIFICGFAFTIAFFTDIVEIPNVFKTKTFKTTTTEEFVSPDNWLPGTTTEKIVKVNNVGDVEAAVRISITETWIASDGTELSGIQNDNKAAIINFVNTSDWIKQENYYYYKNKLAKGETTKNFIESVTFNSEISADSECVQTVGEGIIQSVCESSESGYAGATYTLTIKVETVQYDSYKEIWNTNFEIE